MKYISIILLVMAGVLTSCQDISTGDVSIQTDFPVITLNGETPQVIVQGGTYTEEGAVATEGGEEIPTTIAYLPGTYYGSPGVDTDQPDVYAVEYSAVNELGYSGAAFRTVLVVPPTGDLVTSIEGIYTSDVQRAPSFAPGPPYEDMEWVFITKREDGTYDLTDAIGGYYALGRGYGSNFAARGAVITANSIPANDFSITDAVIPGWGYTAVVTEFEVNPETKTIMFTGSTTFANGTFKVQLTQLQY